MTEFNQDGRKKNLIKASSIGVMSYLIKTILGFVFRTVFLHVLTTAYLGLNGLFSDILSILSLADLGIGTAITYRLYAPIKEKDEVKVAAIMNYFKVVYRIIALVIICLGCAIMPFIKFFIKDVNEIPSDINIYIIYALFLFQTVSSYFFVYKQTLLGADQKNDILNMFSLISNIIVYSMQIILLFVTKKYIVMLVGSIISTITLNFLQSLFVTYRYKEVFKNKKAKLTKEERKTILVDTSALMLHKVGGVVLRSTDAIVITRFVGLAINGIYANYVFIVSAVEMLARQLFSPLTASIGNMFATNDIKKCEDSFFKLQYLGLWIAGFCGIALFTLLNAFIEVWQGKDFLISKFCVLLVVCNFFFLVTSNVSSSFIFSSGNFVRDKIRPLIEASLNVIISIVLALYIGLAGVFIGTVVSCLLTSWWREPYILFKHVFKSKLRNYWKMYAVAVLIILFAGALTYLACYFIPNTIGYVILKFCIVAILPNAIFALCTFKSKYFKYFWGEIKNVICKIKEKIKGEKKQ